MSSVLNGQSDSNYVSTTNTSTNMEIAAVKGKVGALERGIGDYEESRLVVKQELYPPGQPLSFHNQYYGSSNAATTASSMGVYPPPPPSLELKFASDSSHSAYQINYGHSKSYISHV